MKRNDPLLLVLSVAAASAALADIERPCVAGQPIPEVWATIPTGGIVFDLATIDDGPMATVLDTRPAPGFGNIQQTVNLCPAITNEMQTPFLQSFARAADRWNNPVLPDGTSLPSTFAIDDTGVTLITQYPAFDPTNTVPYETSEGMVPDSRSVLTFWEPEAQWIVNGAITAARAEVNVPASGQIVSADVGVNCVSDVGTSGIPFYRFVEENTALGTIITSQSLRDGNNPAPAEPALAWFDLEGVLTHELGHVAGLAHSLIDGPTSLAGSSTPTMFAVAQATPFTGPVTFNLQGCTNHVQTAVDASTTSAGGILGEPARDLTPDDVAALAAGYASVPNPPGFGSIAGSVLDGNQTAIRGAHVVAVLNSDPNGTRIGTFAIRDGSFLMTGVPAGDYSVFVEWPDANGFFDGSGMPEIADPQFSPFCGTPFPPEFEMEYWNGTNESAAETLPFEATIVTVPDGGLAAQSVDFIVEPQAGLRMAASACFELTTPGGTQTICGQLSERGCVHRDLAAPQASVQLQFLGGTPSGVALLLFGSDRTSLPAPPPFGGGLLTVNAPPGNLFTFTLDAAGETSVSLPVSPANVGQSFFAQCGEFFISTGEVVMSNDLTLYLAAD